MLFLVPHESDTFVPSPNDDQAPAITQTLCLGLFLLKRYGPSVVPPLRMDRHGYDVCLKRRLYRIVVDQESPETSLQMSASGSRKQAVWSVKGCQKVGIKHSCKLGGVCKKRPLLPVCKMFCRMDELCIWFQKQNSHHFCFSWVRLLWGTVSIILPSLQCFCVVYQLLVPLSHPEFLFMFLTWEHGLSVLHSHLQLHCCSLEAFVLLLPALSPVAL